MRGVKPQDAGSGQPRPLPRCLSVSRGCENRVERAGDEYCHKCVEKGYRNPPRPAPPELVAAGD